MWRRRSTGYGCALPSHVRPVDGIDYNQVATGLLHPPPQSMVRDFLGLRDEC